MEIPRGITPYKPLLHISGQGDIVREVEIGKGADMRLSANRESIHILQLTANLGR